MRYVGAYHGTKRMIYSPTLTLLSPFPPLIRPSHRALGRHTELPIPHTGRQPTVMLKCKLMVRLPVCKYCATLRKRPYLYIPQFPHLLNAHNGNAYIKCLLWGLSEIIYVGDQSVLAIRITTTTVTTFVIITRIPHSSKRNYSQVLQVISFSVKLPNLLLWQPVTLSDRRIRGQKQIAQQGTAPEPWIRIVHKHEWGLALWCWVGNER